MSTREALEGVVRRALDEDAPEGDLTSRLIVEDNAKCRALLLARADGVVAGTGAAGAAFEVAADEDGLGSVEVRWGVSDGDTVTAGQVVAEIHGPARTVLRAERVAINLLAHLSGVATLTRAFAEAAAPARVLCTRKTTPGLRGLERDAVVAGGGDLHRASLSEAVLIKDNHLRAGGGVRASVQAARAAGVMVEVEAETMDEVREAVSAGADRVLLDNPTPELVAEALGVIGDPERLEVSGGVTLETIGSFTEAGARLISVGRITHSAPALDLSLEVVDVD